MSNIKINAADWSKAGAYQDQITAIMREHGFITADEKIEGSESEPSVSEVVKTAASHLSATAKASKAANAADKMAGLNWCKIGCDIAEAGAVAACALVPAPGNAICVAVAHKGGEICRSKCKP